MMHRTAGHRVIIVGFGGLDAGAKALRRGDVAITLIDRAQHHQFQPTGVRQSYLGHDEFARWAPGKSVADALATRRRAFGAVELAETATNLEEQRRGLALPSSAPASPVSSSPGRSASWPPAPPARGRRIQHRVGDGASLAPFRYYDLGSAAYLSVISAGPRRFAGFGGWLSWLFIHLAFLTGYRNRFGAVATWTATFVRDARRERTFTPADRDAVRRLRPAGRDGPAGRPTVSAARR
jgi:hypothetical protein